MRRGLEITDAPPPGALFVLLWIGAGALSGAVSRIPIPHPITFVLLGVLQTGLLYRHFARRSLLWGLSTIVAGTIGGLAGIVLTAIVMSGLPIPELFSLAVIGLVAGLAVGAGQAFVLIGVARMPGLWIFVSGLAWSAAGLAVSAVDAVPGLNGMDLFNQLREYGLSDRAASSVVGASGGFTLGLISALVTGLALVWLLRTPRALE